MSEEDFKCAHKRPKLRDQQPLQRDCLKDQNSESRDIVFRERVYVSGKHEQHEKWSPHNENQGNRNDLLQNREFNKRENYRLVKMRKNP